jgi:hypothetical protein
MSDSGELPELLARAAAGDQTAVTELFSLYRKRLKQMIRLRLNRRLQGRVDDSGDRPKPQILNLTLFTERYREEITPERKPGAHRDTPHGIDRGSKFGPGDPLRQAGRLLATTLSRSSRDPLGFGFRLVDRGAQLVLE